MTIAVTLFIASSLDGYIAHEDGGIKWLFHDEDYGYTPFLETVDTVIMGRTTFEDALRLTEAYPYEGKRTIVYSKTPEAHEHPKASFTDRSPALLLHELDDQGANHVWLVGGSQLIKSFLEARLVDEFVISVHPILLGEGIPLFPKGYPAQELKLAKAVPYDSGLVQLTYRRPGAEAKGV
jgi:dihydrofolate reductase